MEWSARLNRISPFLILSLLVGTPALAERTKPIEVTLPTSTNPGARIETNAQGQPLSQPNFPTPALTTSTKGKEKSAKKNAKAAAKKSAPLTTTTNDMTTVVPQSPSSNLSEDPSAALEPATPDPVTEQTSAENSARSPASEAGSNPEAIEATGSSATNEARAVLPPAAEAAIILSRNQFYPSRLLVPQGTRVRIWFTTVESKPAALVIEGLKMQRWIASETTPTQGSSSGYFELQRELTRERVTEITLQPSSGTYPFFDALSGARGEIVVE